MREPKGSLTLPPFHVMLFVQDILYGLFSTGRYEGCIPQAIRGARGYGGCIPQGDVSPRFRMFFTFVYILFKVYSFDLYILYVIWKID